jgi:serine/threonine protein kinase
MGIVLSVEQYQTLLVESGLLSRDDVRRFLDDLPTESTPSDAQGLAKALVKAEKLTKFQATAVYQGQVKDLVLGEYEVLDKLGQGGMGVVLLARHRRMDRLAAVKVLPISTMKSPTAVDRFYREAKAAARLSHANIVSAYDASEKDGTHYLVMEFVDGEDLAQVSKQRGPLPVEQAVECMIQAARGLQYAHDQGVIHRDIKPANLLVDRNGTVKILDMGLARINSLADAEPTEQDRLTQSGQVMGTCDYMAPEQAEDTHGADHRADIYALGCSLYRLLTGEAPYQGDSLIKILMAHRDDVIPSLRDKRPDVSEELDSVFQKMVAKQAGDRYQSMTEVIAALEGSRVAAPVGAGPFELQPGASSEPSSDSKLTAFLQGLPEVGVAKAAPRPHGETIQGQAELETGEELDKPRRKKQPAWMLPALIGGGVFLIVMIVGLVMTRSRSGADGQADESSVAQDTTRSEAVEKQDALTIDTQVEPEPIQPPDTELTDEEPATDSAELVGRVPETVAPAAEEMASDEPEESLEEPPNVQPTPVPDVNQEAEAARLAAIETQRAAEAKYQQAIGPVEAMVAEWDFGGAFQAIGSIHFSEPGLTARLATRREEIRLMGALKQRIIAAINAADPRLEKSDLLIRGMGGQITSAAEAGITATLRTDMTESSSWKDLGDRATGKLLELAIDPTNGKMLLAGALLALAAGETGTAETYFDGAEAAGIDIAPYLVSVAAQSLSKAMEILDEQQYADALERLEHIEAEYGSTDWFATNREALAAARATAEKGILDAEAESLYAEAVKLREADQLFDLRDLVARLRSRYASSLVVGDATRSPTFVDLEESVADLGRKFTVRLDGEGDFTSIQAAIDAAPARSLIEIQDSGPYREKLVLPESKPKLTLRGAADSWPVITSNGLGASLRTLVTVRSQHACLERLLLVHSEVPESGGGCLELNAEPSIVRSCILWKAVGHDHCLYSHSSDFRIENCVLLHSVGIQDADMKAKNCIWLRGDVGWVYKSASFENVVLSSLSPAKAVSVRNATILGEVKLPKGSEMIDSIAASIECSHPDVRIEHCNFFSKTPFIDQAKPGKGCFVAPPMLANSKEFDFRLLPNSPCIGKASDGGDLGCRFTPEMLQMYQLAFELRARGIIKF